MEIKTLQFNEALDKPYPYRWFKNDSRVGEAEFDAAGRRMTVHIENHDGYGDIMYPKDGNPDDPYDVHEITFHETSDDAFGNIKWYMTKKGDAFRIMATVLAVITDYVNKHINKIEAIGFLADARERGKVTLYKRLFNKLTPKGKWEKDYWGDGGEYYFIIHREWK